jgi:soluble lytic murein transglycosylase-like protein
MARTQQAILPGVFLSVLALIIMTSLVSHINVAQAAEGSGLPQAPATADISSSQADCSLPQSYPASILSWCSLIESAAGKYGLDGRLIAAVMLQESGGNPDAYSKNGAVGLMQIMPKDGLAADFTCNGRPCFAARPSTAELSDPEFNIDYGARMLAGLIERLGTVRDALKSYGPINYGYTYADKVLNIYTNYQ